MTKTKLGLTSEEWISSIAIFLVISFICIVIYYGVQYKIEDHERQIKTIRELGKEAYSLGIDINANPYSKEDHHREHGIWYRGWIESKKDSN